MRGKFIVVAALSGSLGACGFFGGSDEVAVADISAETTGFTDVELQLPADYKSQGPYLISDRLGQEDQVIVLYANATARFGATTDGKLPNDSTIVGEIYSVKKDADGEVIESQVGRRIPDALTTIVMMQRRAGWGDQYPEELKVGDWEFEVFSPEGENLGKDTTACRECHSPLSETEYTFSFDHMAGIN